MNIEDAYDAAFNQLLVKVKEFNPALDRKALETLTHEFMRSLCEQMTRAYSELEQPPSNEEKEMLLLVLIENGITTEIAEELYRDNISMLQRGYLLPPKLPPH